MPGYCWDFVGECQIKSLWHHLQFDCRKVSIIPKPVSLPEYSSSVYVQHGEECFLNPTMLLRLILENAAYIAEILIEVRASKQKALAHFKIQHKPLT